VSIRGAGSEDGVGKVRVLAEGQVVAIAGLTCGVAMRLHGAGGREEVSPAPALAGWLQGQLHLQMQARPQPQPQPQPQQQGCVEFVAVRVAVEEGV
jgi:hypothetical protein